MEPSSQPGSPGAALQPVTPDHVNQQRESTLFSPTRTGGHSRDSSIHDKISQFNHLAQAGSASAVSMSKQLERKTADAALKRAMLGREAAESEMRRHRDEARNLRRQFEEGRERERRVGERLETVMEQYGRAKETYSHTQALWEKEIRRARKEAFKSQSSIVKLQEEVKAAKTSHRSLQEILEREKERSKAREQEAFAARYQLVGVQEQLEQALERVKLIEQERDAFKTLAKNEEVARIAAEGQLPLPHSEKLDDEFDSPKKTRVSISTADIVSSAVSEAEIDELTNLWQWEKQRADRTQEHLEFLQAECRLSCCPCAKARPRRRSGVRPGSSRKQRSEPVAILDPADLVILGQKPGSPVQTPNPAEDRAVPETEVEVPEKQIKRVSKGPRRSTIFVPSEGTFRTLSRQDAEAMEAGNVSNAEGPNTEPPTPHDPQPEPRVYSRTPSVDPPAFALMLKERTSLMSLLNAPRQSDAHASTASIPKITGDASTEYMDPEQLEVEVETPAPPDRERAVPQPSPRPHTSAAFYGVSTKTTKVPIRDENVNPNISDKRGYQSQVRTPSFDINNPALTPTMTREQALAQIKERRGRARSIAQGVMTPRKQMVTGGLARRDVSAPAGRAVRGRS
ncbi:uncharacterized protein BCR38DRAFT_460059 [Pseudomassariella vexata]|uniref:Uncharacterized protein n=1 Tax=Pseudomassariella vexata TaxID=1141098 RepID=A0A1Y2DLH9_9PEZI|nr:uncharacterized protein BCR38DRAFT_460059 [Pseudomassariella vexata]ORY60097.1 hypothetical protein BCR38DRAFT_460059 [Pseudomassariella vexata]